MADAIVQTIKIQVEGGDEAAAEFKKIGDAGAQSAEQLQSSVAPAAQNAGKGLDQVSEKAAVSGKQLRALGKVAKLIGGEGGELAATAIGFTRMAGAMGAVGVALFAAAEAFAFIKGKMKEAEEAAKAVTTTFANITKVAAEMKVEDEAKFWGTTAAAMKEAANDAGRVADQFRNIAAGAKEAISPLTSQDTLGKAFVKNLERAGISVNDVMADTTKLSEASRQAALEAAKLYEKMSPIEKLNFEKVLKGFGFTDEQIKAIEKGSKALKQAQDVARRPFFTPEQQKSIDNLARGWDAFAQAASRAWRMIAGDAETGGAGWAQTIAAKIAVGFADALAVVGQFERAAVQVLSRLPDEIAQFVTTAPGNAWQWIVETAASVWEQVKAGAQQAYDAVVQFVTAAPGNAWQWLVETFNSAIAGLGAAIAQAAAAVVSFVTTPVGNAWQWIADTFQAVIDQIKQAFGFGGGQAAPAGAGGGGGGGFARGGLLGGRGSGTSDSNLAWVSRGEHIMPAHVVRQPGVLALLESLRLAGGNLRGLFDGMHFAAGGLIMPRAVPAFAGGGMHNVTIQFPGLPEITGLRASSGVVDELRRAAALGQVRSGGRKPSRYS